METKKLNLCEILKDCPKGQELYSPYLGRVVFGGIYENIAAIYVINIEGNHYSFSKDGRYIDNNEGGVSLFPSKDNRDWSKFKPKKERFDPKTLKPFDKVLVRDDDDRLWVAILFSHIEMWEQQIPYNDKTAHLVGTTDEAPEYYKWWED